MTYEPAVVVLLHTETNEMKLVRLLHKEPQERFKQAMSEMGWAVHKIIKMGKEV